MKLTADDWKAALAAGMLTDLTHALDRYQRPVLVLHGGSIPSALWKDGGSSFVSTKKLMVWLAGWGHSPPSNTGPGVTAVIFPALLMARGRTTDYLNNNAHNDSQRFISETVNKEPGKHLDQLSGLWS